MTRRVDFTVPWEKPVAGRRVTIDVGALERLAPYRDYWRYIERLHLQTTAGVVHVELEAAVR